MDMSRISRLAAVVASCCVLCGLPTTGRADELAASVAERLRDSGELSGYRVSVKSNGGTVWLEGRVSDDRQLAAAVRLAESSPGVERVVNRLAIAGADAAESGREEARAAAVSSFSVPASARSRAGG
jgi:Flp pilus assembly secretin CpaC